MFIKHSTERDYFVIVETEGEVKLQQTACLAVPSRFNRDLNIYPSYLVGVHLSAHKPHTYSS